MSSSSNSALTRYFAGATEQTFQTQLGVVDPPLIDYLTSLLTRFLRTDALLKVRTVTGKRVFDIGQMLREADARVGLAKREVHKHIGDFTLFWTGIFPEALRRQSERTDSDCFTSYCLHGKQAYYIASSIETNAGDASGELLERLAEQFELCAYGLREVRREWETELGDGPDAPLLLG